MTAALSSAQNEPMMFSRRPCSAALLVLLMASAALADDDRAAVERHLQRLSAAAQVRGRASGDEAVEVVLGLPWRNRAALDRLVRELADPRSPRYRRYLTPREFARRFAPRAEQLAALTEYLAAAGLTVTEIAPSGAVVTAVGRAARVERALATRLLDVRDAGRRKIVPAAAPQIPAGLGARVVAVGTAPALRPLAPPPPGRAAVALPLDPATVARLYEFDALYAAGVRGRDRRSSTIAIATAFDFDPADLQEFWREFGIARTLDSVELITVEGQAGAPPPPDRRETTLDVEWATAMAPGARVLVYAGTDALSTTFLKVYDRIVSDDRAAVLSTSWGRCESDYPSGFLAQVDAVFARAAAQGITVVAASGDAGAFECGARATPGVSHPASHPYVLAVGGTSLAAGGGEERAWSGSGGGTSVHWPAPPWQMAPGAHRVLADVALHADPAGGYLTRYEGGWHGLGGTSVGAPIWAALVALGNQARATRARPTLGVAAPHLCEVGLAGDPAAFVDVVGGDNGAFDAGAGWDHPTGWGVPRAAALVRALSEWTPPADAAGGVSEIVPLYSTAAGAGADARLRFRRRCLSTEVDLQMRRLPAGHYTLALDGEPVASFTADRRGAATLDLAGVDVRGRHVTVRDQAGTVLFGGGAAPPPPDRTMSAALVGTVMAGPATGMLVYRSEGGRERLTVRAERLPLGTYDVRIGSTVVGTLAVTHSSNPMAALFDSAGASGGLLPTSPLCKPVIVARGAVAYLRSAIDALTPGGCAG